MIKKFEQFISEEYKPHKFYSTIHNDGDGGEKVCVPFEIDDSLKNDSAIKILLTTIETRNIITYAIKAGDDKARREIIKTLSSTNKSYEPIDLFAIISSRVGENNNKILGYVIDFYCRCESKNECMELYRWIKDEIMGDVEKEDFEIFYSYGPVCEPSHKFEFLCNFDVRHKLKGDRNFHKDHEKLYKDSEDREYKRLANRSDYFHYDWFDGHKKDVDRDLEKIK